MRTRPTTFVFALLIASSVFAQATRPVVSAVVGIGMTVSDIDRSVDFYTRVLDFTKIADSEIAGEPYERLTGLFGMRARVVQLKLGEETIELTEFLTGGGREVPKDSRSNDRWFQHIAIVTTDMDRAYARLREAKVRHASTSPQTLPSWNPNAGGIRAFYFKDPDDHVLEIIWFPPGRGESRWQDRRELFAGIDHTAIVVADTDTSLRFYRDQLGLRVAGESENWGTEQEHLNNVFGARLRITTMKAAHGPGIEFLQYLAPRDGRPYPADSRPNDLWHWQTKLTTPDVDALGGHVSAIGSAGIAGVPSVLARDPDGHALKFVQSPLAESRAAAPASN
jgi:catechol 2,3-dioxygenase-like lactoylglutathione lyase family enzyme